MPFCSRRCSYCDFAIAVRRVVPVQEYVKAIGGELAARLASARLGPLRTVYLGGGTPSKLGPRGVGGLLGALTLHGRTTWEPDGEITIEANPEDVSAEAASAWADAGVNRLSLGGQSFDNRALAWMHRTHDAAATRLAVRTARRAGIHDISLDLIFALPDRLKRDWRRDLQEALDLELDHLSLYGLTVETRTPLGRWTARGEVREAPEERYAQEYLLAHDMLGAAGFEHYEVSNFARPGKRSRHNSCYWLRAPYVGIGPSAHSYDGRVRRWNAREYAAWKTRALAGDDPVEGSETLTPQNTLAEEVYLGLRTIEGLSLQSRDIETVDRWVRAGWASAAGHHVVLSAEGWLRLDSLASALTAARTR
ncbi:MAG TPA: radical SAM family heme chaperone HemW [Gemmatimonadaceae bacterium]|nr:radical SAM family heme chaperone HemW [Gemmatimonadaceae bacterium]